MYVQPGHEIEEVVDRFSERRYLNVAADHAAETMEKDIHDNRSNHGVFGAKVTGPLTVGRKRR